MKIYFYFVSILLLVLYFVYQANGLADPAPDPVALAEPSPVFGSITNWVSPKKYRNSRSYRYPRRRRRRGRKYRRSGRRRGSRRYSDSDSTSDSDSSESRSYERRRYRDSSSSESRSRERRRYY